MFTSFFTKPHRTQESTVAMVNNSYFWEILGGRRVAADLAWKRS